MFLCYRIEMSQLPNFNQHHQMEPSQVYQSYPNSCYFGKDATIPIINQRVAMVPIPGQQSTHLLDSGASLRAAQMTVFGPDSENSFRAPQKTSEKNQYSNSDSFNFYNSKDSHSLIPNTEKPNTDATLDPAHSIDVMNDVTNVAKSSKKQHECVICHEFFVSKASLRSHRQCHEPDKYTCTHCHVTFRHRSTLAHHLLTHTRVKQFQCELCAKSFSLKFNLTRHIRKMHNKASGYEKH